MPRTVEFKPKWNAKLGRHVVSIPPQYSDSGKRERPSFESKEDAEAFGKQQRQRVKKLGERLRDLPLERHFMSRTIWDRIDAHHKLTGHLLNPLELINEGIERDNLRNSSKPLADVYQEYLTALRKNGLTEEYIREEEIPLYKFARFSNRLICDLQYSDFKDDLEKYANNTFNRRMETLKRVFSYGMTNGNHYLRINPFAEISKKQTDPGEKWILPIELVQEMFRISKEKYLDYYLALAFCCFGGGMRIGGKELMGLRWRNIHEDLSKDAHKTFTIFSQVANGYFEIPGKYAKNRKKRFIRFVCMSDNFIRCVKFYRERRPTSPDDKVIRLPYEELEKIRNEIFMQIAQEGKAQTHFRDDNRKVQSYWQEKILRRTYATYHLAFYNDPNGLSRQMGHGARAGDMQDLYAGSVNKSLADLYWNID